MFNTGTQLTIKHLLTECRRCETQKSENNIADQLLYTGPKLDATVKMI